VSARRPPNRVPQRCPLLLLFFCQTIFWLGPSHGVLTARHTNARRAGPSRRLPVAAAAVEPITPQPVGWENLPRELVGMVRVPALPIQIMKNAFTSLQPKTPRPGRANVMRRTVTP
jgi:hypothetical protein